MGIIGLSGTGKTYFVEHMIRHDIQAKSGFAVFDVHGDLADNVVRYLAERGESDPELSARTVIIEPFDRDRSVGFNPLERAEGLSAFMQAQEFARMLRERWQDDAFGARTEELLRNSLFTLACAGETVVKMPALLTDKQYRNRVAGSLPQGEVKEFWSKRYDAFSPAMQSAIREPLLRRVSAFITDPVMRDILGQKRSTFSFRDSIRRGLWMVINLSKGRLGENSTILGSMLFTKLELDIMSLADVPPAERRFFSVYADELQNLTGQTYGRLIAEARKYRIGLVSGHQFWNQLDPLLRQAMLAVGSKVLFRVHYHDAVELSGELAPDERNRYIRLLTSLERGEAIVRIGPNRPVVITVPAHQPARPTDGGLERLRSESAARYAVRREDIHPDGTVSDEEVVGRGNQSLTAEEIADYVPKNLP